MDALVTNDVAEDVFGTAEDVLPTDGLVAVADELVAAADELVAAVDEVAGLEVVEAELSPLPVIISMLYPETMNSALLPVKASLPAPTETRYWLLSKS